MSDVKPRRVYVVNGERVPGVTTILGRFKDPGGLIHWAWQQGRDGLDYRETRDAAATAGTLAHRMVDAWARLEQFPEDDASDVYRKAFNAFRQFQAWQAHTGFRIAETEMQLVSQKHRFGGTLDAILITERYAIGDWKTSGHVYVDHLLQLGGYAVLWEENFPDRPIEGGYHLLRFSRDEGDFAHHHWSNLDRAKEGFLALRAAYDCVSDLKRRI